VGEEGLKGGPPPGAGFSGNPFGGGAGGAPGGFPGGTTFSFSTGPGFGGGARFNPTDPTTIFE
jgi:DnaJ homolog subfamily B member 4